MPLPPPSKKAEALKAETKKLEEISKKKLHHINKLDKLDEERVKQEFQTINQDLARIRKKTDDVLSGKEEDFGWDEMAVRLNGRMKQVVEDEARRQHDLLLQTDEATKELELKAKPIRKELPLVSEFSEADRVQLLLTIDRSINKLRERRTLIESHEAKLNKQMQVLMENTPDPSENKPDILAKLQASYDVMSGANDPDRAREELLTALNSNRQLDVACQGSKKCATSKPHHPNPNPHPHPAQAPHPPIPSQKSAENIPPPFHTQTPKPKP